MTERKITIKTIDGIEVSVAIGHTIEEWEETFNQCEDLWDFPIEEVVDGTIEPNTDMVYWQIDDRLYETLIPNREDNAPNVNAVKQAYDGVYAAFDTLYEVVLEVVNNNGGFVNMNNVNREFDNAYGFVVNPNFDCGDELSSENQVVAIASVGGKLMVRFDFDGDFNEDNLEEEVAALNEEWGDDDFFDKWFYLDGTDYCWKLQTLTNIAEVIDEYIEE